MVRAAALLGLLSALLLYFALAGTAPRLPAWGDVAFLALALLPATFLLVWIALPLWRAGPRRLGLAALALGLATALLAVAGLEVAANFTKLAAVVALGFWFLSFFEAVSWVLLVAVLIVPVDIVSVARGPTREIVENQPEVFGALSVSFPLPGEPGSSAQLGLPDILFFSLFLAAAVRFGLRPLATWAAMALSFGATLALAVGLDVAGLPALPLLSAAFALANGDLLWRSYRERSAMRSN